MADRTDCSHWLLDRISAFGSREILIEDNTHYTYSQLQKAVRDAQRFLDQQDIRSGQVVAILSDYSFESIALFLALLANKNIIVPITVTLENEIQERLLAGAVDLTISIETDTYNLRSFEKSSDKHALIRELQHSDQAGLILFSSGSTGKPKAMIHNLDTFLDVYKDKKARKLVMLIFLMFDHIGGLNTLFNALSMGATMVLSKRREPEAIAALIQEHRVTLLPTTPTFLNLLLISEAYKKYDLSSLRIITYGTEPMPTGLLARLKNAFPKPRLIQTFGTSETGISQTFSLSSNSIKFRIDDPNVEYKIVDGELWLRSKTRILGYLNHQMDSFSEDGWFKTGDLAEESPDGYLTISGRSKEIINVGGEKVLPSEVESALLEMPEVVDCIVYGQPNAIVGQMVTAEVVLSQEADAGSFRKVMRYFCREKLDAYKIPSKVEIVSDISFSDRFKKIRIQKN